MIRNGAYEDILRQAAAGEFDGVAVSLSAPAPEVAALEANEPIQFIQPSAEQIALLRTRFPELTPSLIPAGTYTSQREDYHTLGLYNFAIVHRDLPDDLAYRIVKAVFEHHEEMVSAHPAAKETLAVNLDRDTFLPLHPGAARYYREIGISIPPAIAPAN